MKIKHILILSAVVAFSSCSTAYRSGQTPDDVYYSPAPEQNSYVNSVNEQDRNSYGYQNDEEQQIRQGIQNPAYRTPITLDLGYGMGYSPYGYDPYSFNSFGYGYDPYGYKGMYNPYAFSPYGGYGGYGGLSFYNNLYSPFSMFSPYSYYSSPYYGNYGYSPYYNSGKSTFNTNQGARRYNLAPYHRPATTSSTGSVGIRNTIETTRPANTAPVRRTTGVGNVIRRVFTPSQSRSTYNTNSNNSGRVYNNNSNNRSSNERNTPTREYSNPPSVSSPSPSRSSSSNNSAPVRSFRR